MADTPSSLPAGAARKNAVGEIRGSELKSFQYSWELAQTGDNLLKSGDYTAAEKKFRASEVAGTWNPEADRGLAEALAAEGKLSEALQIYRVITTENPNNMTTVTHEIRTQMGFAILLSQMGQWPESVTVYEKALPDVSHFGDAPKIDVHFDPQVPMPAQLQALAHVAIGTEYFGYDDRERAFSEFGKAIHLDPSSGFANYYYDYGWQALDPKDKEKISDAQQAKAALQKAGKIGTAEVKAAAKRALKNAG